MMGKKRILAMAAATLALGAIAGGIAQAGDEWVHERRAEAILDVPRNADGSIDGQAFVNEVDSLVARGVRVMDIRDASFTQEEARSLLIPLEGNLVGHLAARLPNDGIQRQITLRGEVDVRVQRLANGELRASIKDFAVENPTEARRAEFTQQLAERYGLDRLTVRAIDAQGNRLRVEYRADQGIVRNEARAGHGSDREYHADRHDKRRAEANLDVPRNADGTLDGQTFVNEVDSLVARGVRVIHFRDGSFTQEEARSLLIPLEGNLVGELAQRLPNDGIQRQITLRGEVDVRVQRKANGELRASIKDFAVENPTEARRAEFTQQLAERYGLDRLTVRAIDAQGNRLRVEYRVDQGIVRNEVRVAGHRERGEDHADRRKEKDRGDDRVDHRKDHRENHAHHDKDHRGDRADHRKDRGEDRAERGEHRDRWEHRADHREDRAERREDRMDRSERQAKFERPERRDDRMERPERHAKFERPERREGRMDRPERHASVERAERAERAERPERREDRMERPERHVKFERPERHERVQRPERAERAARPERIERPDRSGRH